MAGYGSTENPYVENPIANRIVNVNWQRPISGWPDTLVSGLFAAQAERFGARARITTGIVDHIREQFLGSVSLECAEGETVSDGFSIGGALDRWDGPTSGPGSPIKDLYPYFIYNTGTFWQRHPVGFPVTATPIANIVEPPYDGHARAQIYVPGSWSCQFSAELTFPPRGGGFTIEPYVRGSITCTNHYTGPVRPPPTP